jgi:hypothetical protein
MIFDCQDFDPKFHVRFRFALDWILAMGMAVVLTNRYGNDLTIPFAF